MKAILSLCSRLAYLNGHEQITESSPFSHVATDEMDFAELLVKSESILNRRLDDRGVSEDSFETVGEFLYWATK